MNQHTSYMLVVLSTCVTCVVGCEFITPEVITTEPLEKVAIANITAIDGSSLTGTATFTETEMGVHTVIEIHNATPGLHASHLHIGSNCADVGPHWHPMNVPAGTVGISIAEASLDMPPIGIGEIGNIPIDENGTGALEFTTPFWSIGGEQSTDILGKLMLIHETGDTFRTHPHTHGAQIDNTDTNQGTHTHTVRQMESGQAKHLCTLAVLGQQIDLETAHHLPGELVSPHSHDLLEILLTCFLRPEQLVDPQIAFIIPLEGTPEHQEFMEIDPKTLAAYHEYFTSIGLPVDPDFFNNQFNLTFSNSTPEDIVKEMQNRLTYLYITSGIDIENPADASGYSLLLTMFLDDRTTAWVLGYFQGDDAAFGEWLNDVLGKLQVRPGGGSRVGCGVIELIE